MEGNKDAARQCVAKAVTFLHQGQRDKAQHWLSKAERLYPSLPELSVARAAMDRGSASPPGSGSPAPAPAPAPAASTTRRRATRAKAQQPVGDQRPYTPEQQQRAEAVLTCKTHYEVLGLERTATGAEVKKAYRKLVLKFHPDKNAAPAAADAFKKISDAFTVLSSEEKRQNYDNYGHEDGAQAAAENAPHATGFYGGQPMTPEDLFNMLFSQDDEPFTRMRHGAHVRGRRYTYDGQPAARSTNLFQLLPILVLLLVTMLNFGTREDPYFRLAQTTTYAIRRETSSSSGVVPGLEYWVKSDFRRQIGHSRAALRQIELAVQDEVVNNLRKQCSFERDQLARLRRQASNAYGPRRKNLMRQALNFETPSCDKLKELFEQ